MKLNQACGCYNISIRISITGVVFNACGNVGIGVISLFKKISNAFRYLYVKRIRNFSKYYKKSEEKKEEK